MGFGSAGGGCIIAASVSSDIPNTLERFRRGPELLAVVLTGVFGEEEDFAIAPGKWSIRQIVAHLADMELCFAHRFRQVIAEDNPTLVAVNQDDWMARLDSARRKPKQSLESFRRLRGENYELLKELPAADYERAGTHTERGRLTLEQMVELCARHVESHASQMQAIRDEYKRVKGKK